MFRAYSFPNDEILISAHYTYYIHAVLLFVRMRVSSAQMGVVNGARTSDIRPCTNHTSMEMSADPCSKRES